jgi:multidrug resistance efflux pump
VTEDHAERLRTLEATVAEIRVRQTQMESLLEQQVATARQIKSDTEEIVSLIKGANVLARLAKWLTLVVGGYLAGKGLKWW